MYRNCESTASTASTASEQEMRNVLAEHSAFTASKQGIRYLVPVICSWMPVPEMPPGGEMLEMCGGEYENLRFVFDF